MSNQQLQVAPEDIPFWFTQGKTVDGGTVHGKQISVVGFIARIGELTVSLGGKRMHHARLERGGAERLLDDVVIAAGSFDGDDAVLDGVRGERFANLGDRVVQGWPIVLQRRRI